jgi:hypothetical protein
MRWSIYDASHLRISVEREEGNPVISVDPNGTVHALRVGSAVLVGNFDGVVDKIKVTVTDK